MCLTNGEVLETETYPQLGLTRELQQAAKYVLLSALAALQAPQIERNNCHVPESSLN